ncbi:MAG: hypothetical protein IPM21_14560 [Acidobacteria bacterium]|nr:hypothetical protein [Acidobacteriota bacterium]
MKLKRTSGRSHFFGFVLVLLGFAVIAEPVIGQDAIPTPSPSPVATPAPSRGGTQELNAEQVAESAIIIYGLGSGRLVLDQIRRTTFERGKLRTRNQAGTMDSTNYQRWVIRGENSAKDKVRWEQELPAARYSLMHVDDRIFGVFNDSVFTPQDEAVRSFEQSMFRGLDALLRYKENESKLELIGREKQLGVEYFVVEVTDKKDRKTKFYVSVRTFRVMMLEYEDLGVNYKRKFYDYRYAQGTLVPYRTVLWADDLEIQEASVGTITFGQKVDEGMFLVG